MANVVTFKEKNFTFTAPEGMDNCGDLPCHVTDEFSVSCWQLSWRERFSALIFGKVWHFNYTQRPAPVAISVARTVFEQPKEAK
jgi:hypothetical protein